MSTQATRQQAETLSRMRPTDVLGYMLIYSDGRTALLNLDKPAAELAAARHRALLVRLVPHPEHFHGL